MSRGRRRKEYERGQEEDDSRMRTIGKGSKTVA